MCNYTCVIITHTTPNPHADIVVYLYDTYYILYGTPFAIIFSMEFQSILEISGEGGRIRQEKLPFGFSGAGDTVNAVLCGKFLELTISPEKVHCGFSNSAAGGETNKEPETPESILARSAARSRRQVRRLCNCNNLFFMHTLTFAVEHIKYFKGELPFVLIPLEEQKDRDKVVELWKAFARKLRKKEYDEGRDLRYIAVIERHTGKRAHDTTIKEGCFHIHFVSDRLYHKRQLQHLWQHGLCNHSDWTQGRKRKDLDEIDTLPAPDNPGAYLSKYIGKDSEQTEGGKKRYWASKNLKKPLPIKGSDALKVAAFGMEIYTRDRTIVTLDDGTQIHSYTSTRVLPDDKLYRSEFSGVSDTPEKRRHKQLKIQYENYLYQQQYQERVRYENIYRRPSQGIIDRATERSMRLVEWARREDKAAEMESIRIAKTYRQRIPELGGREGRIKKSLLGRKRFRVWKKGHLHPDKRVVFRSKSS